MKLRIVRSSLRRLYESIRALEEHVGIETWHLENEMRDFGGSLSGGLADAAQDFGHAIMSEALSDLEADRRRLEEMKTRRDRLEAQELELLPTAKDQRPTRFIMLGERIEQLAASIAFYAKEGQYDDDDARQRAARMAKEKMILETERDIIVIRARMLGLDLTPVTSRGRRRRTLRF